MIAVLGATGYVGRSLARMWAANRQDLLVLFARNPVLLAAEPWPSQVSIRALSDFNACDFALVINAIGAGDPTRVGKMGASIPIVTYDWDQRVLQSMAAGTRYVFVSSGAIYGGQFARPVEADDIISLPVNRLGNFPPYVLAKLHTEALHRYAADRPILDVRLFGYADPSIPVSGTSFLAELARSVKDHKPFVTSTDDMVRDYSGAQELLSIIECWVRSGSPNRCADLYTLAPVAKREVLAAAVARYNLEVKFVARAGGSPTGQKAFYTSTYRAAAEFGYAPERTSLEVVLATLDGLA